MKRALLLSGFLLVFSSNAFALTWDEAVAIAGRNSHELISASKQLESSEWSYRKSYSTFLPHLSASASLGESESGGATSKSTSYGLSLSQTLFKGMEGIYSIQSAYADLEYQKADLQSTQASVYYDLRQAFVELLVSQEKTKLLAEILKQRQQNSRLIQLRYDSGKEDKGNLMTTRADEKQAEYDLASAKRELKLAQLKLSQLLQIEVDKVGENKQIEKPASVDYDNLLRQTPSYIMAAKQLEKSELAQKSSISGFLPSVSLSGSYRKSGSDWPPDSTSKSWSLSLSYPIFSGGSNIADRAIAGAQLDQAREDFALSVKELRYNLEETYQSYLNALESLSVAEVSLAASQERAKIAGVKYLNGLTGYDEWYRIENTYVQSQKSLLNSRKSALLAEALWYKSYGGYVK